MFLGVIIPETHPWLTGGESKGISWPEDYLFLNPFFLYCGLQARKTNLTMEQISGIELLVFDLDGTLVNSQYDLGDAVNFALFSMAMPQLAYEEIPPMLGGGVRRLLAAAVGTSRDEEINKALVYFNEFYEKNHAVKTDYYPGVRATLAKFQNRTMAVLSNKPHRFTKAIVQKLDEEKYFDLVLGAQPELYGLKPSPEGLAKILQKLNIAASKTLVIGDSTHDIQVGKSLGSRTCAVTYGYRSREVLAAENPDVMIDSITALKEVVL
jgi:phosphoglycolate phosphatase